VKESKPFRVRGPAQAGNLPETASQIYFFYPESNELSNVPFGPRQT
jgi:hypothetical protein